MKTELQGVALAALLGAGIGWAAGQYLDPCNQLKSRCADAAKSFNFVTGTACAMVEFHTAGKKDPLVCEKALSLLDDIESGRKKALTVSPAN